MLLNILPGGPFFQFFLGSLFYAIVMSAIFMYVVSKIYKKYTPSLSDAFMLLTIIGFFWWAIFDILKPSNPYYIEFGLLVYFILTFVTFKWLNLRFKLSDKLLILINLFAVLIFFYFLINNYFYHSSVFSKIFGEDSKVQTDYSIIDSRSKINAIGTESFSTDVIDQIDSPDAILVRENSESTLDINDDAKLNSMSNYDDYQSFEQNSIIKDGVKIDDSVKKYVGDYFDINIPKGFEVDTMRSSVDHVTLVTDVDNLEFYVYSPLWRGEPDFLEQNSDEKLISKEEKKLPRTSNELVGTYRIYTYYTYENINTGVIRSVLDQRSQIGMENRSSELRLVFGFTYPDIETYEKFKSSYLEFKNSLHQYAD